MSPAPVDNLQRLIRLREALATRANTELIAMTAEELARFQVTFPDAPRHIVELFRVIGEARIDGTGYTVHCWLSPEDIYDPVTAEELGGLVIVGVGSTGACEAYNTRNQWQFGTITESCHFWPDDGTTPTMIDFLEDRYLAPP